MSNRYLLFAGDSFYAKGGWLDVEYFSDYEDTLEHVLAKAVSLEKDWWHIVDTEYHRIVYSKSGSYCGEIDG